MHRQETHCVEIYRTTIYSILSVMQSNCTVHALTAGNGTADERVKENLADFSTDRRVLVLSAMAIGVGAMGALAAHVLVSLINFITNLAFHQRLSILPAVPEGHHLGYRVVAFPVVGALLIGLMARYGSDKIRGHGIPEALEAILLGRS